MLRNRYSRSENFTDFKLAGQLIILFSDKNNQKCFLRVQTSFAKSLRPIELQGAEFCGFKNPFAYAYIKVDFAQV